MGIDNSASIIFGVSLDYDEFVNMVRSCMTEEDKDDDISGFYYDHIEGGGRFEERYEDLKLYVASPYYDSEFEDRTFYLYLEKAEEIDVEHALQVINSGKHSFSTCLKYFGISNREPKFIAVVDIN